MYRTAKGNKVTARFKHGPSAAAIFLVNDNEIHSVVSANFSVDEVGKLMTLKFLVDDIEIETANEKDPQEDR